MSLFFTKRKFLNYSKASQHKKASEVVKALYLELLYKNKCASALLSNYHELSLWMELSQVRATLENLSSRYHFHIEKASLSLKEHQFLPRVNHLDGVIAEDFLPIDIYLDNIRSSFNIGSIMRTTEALRLGKLFFSKEMAKPNHKKVLDTAMGSENFQKTQIFESFNALRSPIIAIETTEEAIPIDEYHFPKSFTLIFGNEETGISQNNLIAADVILKIPLHGIKNSLNVASAFSILAYEIRRQYKAPS